jgi:mannitol/fructose-specific phosphotransferase system IIA component (Ntr-type)
VLLSDIFHEQSIVLNLTGKIKADVLTELVAAIAVVHPEYDQNIMLNVIQERESKMGTGIGSGVAIPHGCCSGMNDIIGAIGISKTGIDDYHSLDNQPVHILFLMVMGEHCREKHLHVLSRVMELCNSEALTSIRTAKSVEEIHAMLSRFN